VIVSKTTLLKSTDVKPEWFLFDGDGLVVGRLATKIATILMGKHKPTYTAHVDTGDYVIVVNCEKVRFGGRPMASDSHPYFTDKQLKKEYDYYTRHPGGRKVQTAAELFSKHPELVLELAVKRMLPKSALGKRMLDKLKLYVGPNHPHSAQQPKLLKPGSRPKQIAAK
jgi:large subunit ribosomal protein L13